MSSMMKSWVFLDSHRGLEKHRDGWEDSVEEVESLLIFFLSVRLLSLVLLSFLKLRLLPTLDEAL